LNEEEEEGGGGDWQAGKGGVGDANERERDPFSSSDQIGEDRSMNSVRETNKKKKYSIQMSL
jgi:hypothetical protein